MMQVNYTPIRANFQFKIEGETIYIKQSNVVYKIDFSNLPDGKMVTPIDFVPLAERTSGELTVSLLQPVDSSGAPIEPTEFDTNDSLTVEVPWKTWQQIDAPKPPSDKERLAAAEQAIIMLMMEG